MQALASGGQLAGWARLASYEIEKKLWPLLKMTMTMLTSYSSNQANLVLSGWCEPIKNELPSQLYCIEEVVMLAENSNTNDIALQLGSVYILHSIMTVRIEGVPQLMPILSIYLWYIDQF